MKFEINSILAEGQNHKQSTNKIITKDSLLTLPCIKFKLSLCIKYAVEKFRFNFYNRKTLQKYFSLRKNPKNLNFQAQY